jgi:hypothetical protein
MRTSLLDPALVAAGSGFTVIARPIPGPAGQAIVDRLALLAGPMEGALMIPIRPGERLAGVLELGRREVFRSAEIASLEALVEALAAKLEGWARA